MTDKRIVARDMDGVPLTREDLSIVNKLLDKMNTDPTIRTVELLSKIYDLEQDLKQRDETIIELRKKEDNLLSDYKTVVDMVNELKEALGEMMRFAFDVRNSTNLSSPGGKDKVIKINSLIDKVGKLLTK